MCGLNFSLVGGAERVMQMNNAISHRGMYSTEPMTVNGMAVGHVRLPIQGLSEEFDQPFRYGDWLIAYVGEIFNYKRARLRLNPG